LFEINKIELRDVEQIVNRFFVSLDYVEKLPTSSNILINTVVLITGLIEQHLDKTEITERKNKSNGINFSIAISQDVSTLGYSLSNMVRNMFLCVTTTMSSSKFGGQSLTYNSPQEMLAIQSTKFSHAKLLGENHNSYKFFTTIINHYDNLSGDCSYWMWEDYQKVIELSGNIE